MARIGELIGPNGEVMHPKTSAEVVYLEDGRSVEQVLSDDIDYGNVVFQDNSYKFDSDVEDDFAKTVIIKGQTYQNILPEPSTHVLTNNKGMFKVNEGLDPNVEIVDGVSKSAILSGNTLVNLIPEGRQSTFHINNVSGGGYGFWNSPNVNMIKPSTKYLVLTNVTLNTGSKIVINNNEGFISCFTDGIYYEPNEVGIKKTILTSKSDLSGCTTILRSYTHMVGEAKGTIQVFEYQQGMENWDIPYFTGMQSVKAPVLKTTGKNLVDLSTSIYGEGYNNVQTDFIKINPNKTFIASMNNQYGSTVTFYTQNKEPIITINGFKVTSPSNAYYLRWVISTQDRTADWNSFQIEEGAVATSYEPYKTNILSCELVPLNQPMFEQGTFSESTPPNTRPYEGIKVNSGNLYTTRIRTKGTYKVVKGAIYSGQLNNGYSIFICYCKNGLYSAKDKGWIDETNFTFTVPNDCDEMFFALRKTDNSAITPSDYSRIGLKIHQEVVLRSLPNGVCDTLNLNTGEYVQRIKEVVFDGSSDESIGMVNVNDTTLVRFNINNVAGVQTGNTNKVLCSSLPYLYIHGLSGGSATVSQECISNHSQDANVINIVIKRSRLSSVDVAGFRAYLQSNPIAIQYSIATPIVKTVDLSSSGNWEKVVLDGSESWSKRGDGDGSTTIGFQTPVNGVTYTLLFAEGIERSQSSTDGIEGYGFDSNQKNFFIELKRSRLTTVDVNGFKQYLQQNPITLWYQTQTHQDSTQVKQPIFFKDGHIIQSSVADHSLIPTLDYQAKTSNSYVMDLMKTNTKYTMKAKSANGTFTIDGTSYGAGTNGTFTTPSSMTNKLLVMSNKANEEVMILEGDVVSKTIPYFKGIKSAFEDQSQMEVLSQNKNLLWNLDANNPDDKFVSSGGGTSAIKYSSDERGFYTTSHRTILVTVKPNTKYTLSVSMKDRDEGTYDYRWLLQVPYAKSFGSSCKEWTRYSATFTTDSTGVVRVNIYNTIYFKDMMLEECSTMTDFDLCETNSTKIPLLSPLRSLPNGTCDELIIDRMKKKATLIQRVGEIYATTSYMSASYFSTSSSNNYRNEKSCAFLYNLKDTVLPFNRGETRGGAIVCEGLPSYNGNTWNTSIYTCAISGVNSSYDFCFRFPNSETLITLNDSDDMVRKQFNRHLDNKNMKLLYELKTPIITEVDLEGFPYIYKDGHIFLNSEITPTVGIEYGINQGHRIEGQVETLQRHEKQFTQLERYFADLVHSDYNFALLRFSEKLHQQEGDV